MHGLGYPSMHVAAGDFSVPCPGDYNAFADMTMSDTPEVARKRKRVKTGKSIPFLLSHLIEPLTFPVLAGPRKFESETDNL